jgi:2-polyprenyl-6-hydroxyphenyl methylase/3-demethylubiquinone-9 3-methyltransferase
MSQTRDGAARGEQQFYDRQAARFWDPHGPMRALHVINPLRAAWIADRTGPLAGRTVLDVGCAVGLLSEALTRRGAHVTGIDVSEENIAVATRHATGSRLSIAYRAGTLNAAVASEERFDIVCCLEVVEHVENLKDFLAALATHVVPGGLLFVSSIARTPESLALAKITAEYVLGILPRGTHRWSDFRNPEEVDAELVKSGLKQIALTGMGYMPLLHRAWWQRNTRVNWMGAWSR